MGNLESRDRDVHRAAAQRGGELAPDPAIRLAPTTRILADVDRAAGAAVLLYNLLRTIDDLFLRALPFSPARSYFIALIVLLFTLPTYGFLTALFGGWDPGGVKELERAVALSGPGQPIAWLLALGVRVGAQASPLHGRFPMALREIAEEEAWALTHGRAQID